MKRSILLAAGAFFIFTLSVSAQMRNFTGDWVNRDSRTSGITRLQITESGGRAYVRAWGQCSPTDCDWGRATATKYHADVSSDTVNGLTTRFESRGISRMLVLKMRPGRVLEAQVMTRYTADRRPNTMKVDTFRRQVGPPRPVLPAPTLVSPRNGARFSNFPRRLTLSWRPVRGATAYRVEVQYYDRGARRWISDYLTRRVSATRFTFNFVGDQPGRWRVRAMRGSTAGRSSAWRSFSYGTAPAVLRAPGQISPRSNAVFNNFPRRTTLRWRPVSGAAYYMVEVQYYDPSRRRWIGNYKLERANTTAYTFRFVGAQPGRWRVWAVGRNGTAGRKSPWRGFRYTR